MHPTRHRHYDGTARREAQDSHQVAKRMLPMQTETYQSTCPHSILSLRSPANHSVLSDMLPLPQQMVLKLRYRARQVLEGCEASTL